MGKIKELLCYECSNGYTVSQCENCKDVKNIVSMSREDMDALLEQVADSFFTRVYVSGAKAVKHGTRYLLSLEGEDGDFCFEVNVIFSSFEHWSQQGIHLKEVDEFRLSDAIEQAQRDGFETIYVHSILTKGEV